MFLFIPFRAKNPSPLFPWVTLALMAVNILVFALTSHYFLLVEVGVVKTLGLSYHNFSILTVFTSMFLHGSLFHLLGNMLALWIFGTAVEGRLGHWRYLGFYLFAGVIAQLTHVLLFGIHSPKVPEIGASGAIMGLEGAYLYLFPFARISCFYLYPLLVGFRAGIAHLQAQWTIAIFFVLEYFEMALTGMMQPAGATHAGDGVAHFAHLGGFAAGFLIPLALRMRRDSEEVSDAQAVRSDVGGNLLSLSLAELEALMDGNPEDLTIALAFLRKAATHYDPAMRKMGAEALKRHGASLIEAGNPDEIAVAILGNEALLVEAPVLFLFRLGEKLEQTGSWEMAARSYRAVCLRAQMTQTIPPRETEMALARLARMTEQKLGQTEEAAAIWVELLRLYPQGPQADYAQAALRRLGKPAIVFSAGTVGGKVNDDAPTASHIPDGLAIVSAPSLASHTSTIEKEQPPSSFEDIPQENASGLIPVAAPTAWTGGFRPSASAVESAYTIGDVSGISLSPIGGPSRTTSTESAPSENG